MIQFLQVITGFQIGRFWFLLPDEKKVFVHELAGSRYEREAGLLIGSKSGKSLLMISDALGRNGCLVRFLNISTRSNFAMIVTPSGVKIVPHYFAMIKGQPFGECIPAKNAYFHCIIGGLWKGFCLSNFGRSARTAAQRSALVGWSGWGLARPDPAALAGRTEAAFVVEGLYGISHRRRLYRRIASK